MYRIICITFVMIFTGCGADRSCWETLRPIRPRAQETAERGPSAQAEQDEQDEQSRSSWGRHRGALSAGISAFDASDTDDSAG